MIQDALANVWKIKDLRSRLIFTAAMLAVFRVGAHIPVPGVSPEGLSAFWAQSGGGIFGMIDMFSGGAFQNFSLFALGIMPYINASIILQLLTVVYEPLGALAKEGEMGRQKITQYTRWLTVLLAAIQGAGLTYYMVQAGAEQGVIPNPNFRFYTVTILSLATGTAFLMWVGEQITERGIGNGISILISAGIIAATPSAVLRTGRLFQQGEINAVTLALLGLLMVATIAVTVVMTLGVRKIPIQFARRVRGRRVYAGQSQFIPLRVNAAGVIPVIFAQAMLMLPAMMGGIFPAAQDPTTLIGTIFEWIAPGSFIYNSVYGLSILFFTFFYTAIIINPDELADNLKKQGASVPGIRPGRPTAQHIEWIITRITMAGGLMLVGICIIPPLLFPNLDIVYILGGTALLIIVGVQLDTLKQLESHLLQRHYDGFLKKGTIGARR